MALLSLLAAAIAAVAVNSVSAATVSVRRYVVSEEASGFDTELDNGWRNESVVIEPSATALVMIDVWDDHTDPVLAENEALRLLPLLTAARKAGMLVIHAPSEAPEWRNVSAVLPGEILVTGTNGTAGSNSRCDVHILSPPAGRRPIRHVLVAGYDTNKCVIDKPCGTVALSTAIAPAGVEVLLVRDATRGQYGTLENNFYGNQASVNLLELGWWLRAPARADADDSSGTDDSAAGGIRSLVLRDLLDGLGDTATALSPLQFPVPTTAQRYPPDSDVPAADPSVPKGVALVVVSCSSDYLNDGFRARVMENRHDYLEPLLWAFRAAPGSFVIHVPNGHVLDGGCTPRAGEPVAQNTAAFDQLLNDNGIGTLYYAGYAANTDMLFGAGGIARYYSNSRYKKLTVPRAFWVKEATIAVESPATIEGLWAQKYAMSYRTHNVVPAATVADSLCGDAPSDGPAFFSYSLGGVNAFGSPADVVTDTRIDGSCGPTMLGHPTVTISLTASVASLGDGDRKALCFVKSVGTPFAVFQLKAVGSALQYQTANQTGWSTLSVPEFFTTANVTHALSVIHNGTRVTIYKDGVAVAAGAMPVLDYTHARAMVVGARKPDSEYWVGELGDVLVRSGSYPPVAPKPAGLVPSEVAALKDIWSKCGGAAWKYALGTDAVGGAAPWTAGDPCATGWFGVKCDPANTHVLQLFPNTRFSGNPLEGCQLPDTIGDFALLEHFYASNDRTPSHLTGPIPAAMGKLSHLKCMYFSHTGVSGPLPRELEQLTNLQVFLVRSNNLTGPLIDFSKLPHLRNVWFDSQPLTGNLSALGLLQNLTFLQATGTDVSGLVPPALCDITCDASGTELSCSPSLPEGCCKVVDCGRAPKAPTPKPASMGECFPQ